MTVGRITHPAASAARVATGRVSPSNASNMSISSTSATRRLLFGVAPDPVQTKRYCDENSRNEQQRCIQKYGFDPMACRYVNASSLSSSSSSGGGGSSAEASAAASQMRHHHPFQHHHRQQ